MTSQVVINDVEPRSQAVAFSGQVTFNTNWTADAATDIVVYRRASDEDADDQGNGKQEAIESIDCLVHIVHAGGNRLALSCVI